MFFFVLVQELFRQQQGQTERVQGVGKDIVGKYFPVPDFQLFIAGAWERELQTPWNHPG